MKELKVYWWSALENGKKNFGDWLSPLLCEAISGKKVVYSPPNKCDLVAIGSVLQKLKNHFWTHRTHVWGAGLISAKPPFNTPHYIHAVRGKKTAETIKNKKIETIGDPGLLSEILLKNKKEKKFKVGIVPHYVDQSNLIIEDFLKNKKTLFIDVFSETNVFMEKISSCDFILSSSLHGIIIADALNIPNAWIKLSHNVRGEDFKFLDYYSIYDIENIVPFKFNEKTSINDVVKIEQNYNRPGIEKIKERLYLSFPFK